ncbi:AraC family transcriptional regulator [Devosia sp. FKR38]|uniref:helix-turn-helix transcriptional regulator n=1 Tax=Devosia sp. FKR38 TaxID=2562312 RepID=UPI0010C0E1DA|nr:AraC family transcriptional regulator [Devosia sp. FKR38]
MGFFTAPIAEGSSFDGFLSLLQQGSIEPFRAEITGKSSDFRWRSELVASPSLVLLRAQYTQDWGLVPETASEGLSVIIPTRDGGLEARMHASDHRVEVGAALLAPNCQLERILMLSAPGLQTATLVFSSEAVQRVLSTFAEGVSLSRLGLMPILDLGSSVGGWFRQIALALSAGMHKDRPLERSPLAFELLVEAALQILLTQLPNRINSGLPTRAPQTAPRHVRRAIDYMHAHLHEPITIGEIASHAGIGVRGLQWAFRQYCDTSPGNYLRRIRLDAVHLELSNPGNILPVSEVALKWGFVHMGRFAAEYGRAFGRLPSETLRLTRSRH